MDSPGEHSGRHRKVRVDDIGLPFANVAQSWEQARCAIQAHLVNPASIRNAPGARGTKDVDTIDLLVLGMESERSGLDANLMSAPESKPWGLHEFTAADVDGNFFRVFYDFATPELGR